jgi:branched-chain amino acid transport system substrate-binding protein
VPSELAMTGWINADQAFQGLLAAGPEFSRQGVADASNAFTAYSAGGLLNPIDWSRQKDAPTPDDPVSHGYVLECLTPVVVVNAAFETYADPSTPWLCWENSDKSWSEPVPTTFGEG